MPYKEDNEFYLKVGVDEEKDEFVKRTIFNLMFEN